jgi:hypothetical protein
MMSSRRKRSRKGEGEVGAASRARRTVAPEDDLPPVRKLVAFDARTWQTLDLMARDSMRSFQELADEAFRDLLRKHGRADTLRGALRQSVATAEAVGEGSPRRSRAGRKRRAAAP